ncbi:MAG: thermonuclease family protein [Actinobacteria bacterium]|nr:thermonuclease family protein [Actinomycetota bacterium]
MTQSRRRSLVPWSIAAALAAVLILGRAGGDGKPQFDGAAKARVQRVVDGDTVRLAGLGSVRLIGVNTPEVYGHRQCYGPEASAFTKHVLPRGLEVRYRVGREAHDRYGRLLAYVWLPDGRLFNRLLAEDGFAVPLTISPNDQLASTFRAASADARRAGRGMWARPGCAPPSSG